MNMLEICPSLKRSVVVNGHEKKIPFHRHDSYIQPSQNLIFPRQWDGQV